MDSKRLVNNECYVNVVRGKALNSFGNTAEENRVSGRDHFVIVVVLKSVSACLVFFWKSF